MAAHAPGMNKVVSAAWLRPSLHRSGGLLRDISDRMAPRIRLPKPPPGLPAMASLLHLG